MNLDKEISRAVGLRKKGQHTEALAIFLDLLKLNAGHAVLQHELASTYDSQGLEADAIPHYECALALGLEAESRRGALLGLGSSYRCVEQYSDAVRTFERGIAEYPNANEFGVFLALTLHNLGDHARAMTLLLTHIAEHTSDKATVHYKRAIFHYAEHLQPPYEDS